jgi:hypothetical protein
LAFLPEPAVLADLLARMSAKPAAAPGHTASPRPRDPDPATPRRGTTPPRTPAPALQLQELQSRLEPLTSLDACFESFVGWLKQGTQARAVFVADAEGLSMVRTDAGDGYAVAASEISMVLDKLKALLPDVDQGSTLLRLGTRGDSVELVWCKTRLGRFTVGLVLPQPLEPEQPNVIRAALTMVAADAREG